MKKKYFKIGFNNSGRCLTVQDMHELDEKTISADLKAQLADGKLLFLDHKKTSALVCASSETRVLQIANGMVLTNESRSTNGREL